MKKLAVFAAVCAALFPTAATRAAGPGKPTVTLNFVEIQTSSAATIPYNQRPTLGNQFSFHSEFYKWNGTKRGAHLGHADVSGVFLTENTVQITGVASLPGGTLTVVGQSGNQRVTILPVVGGTGIYATARGEVIIHNLGGPNSNTSADTLRLWT